MKDIRYYTSHEHRQIYNFMLCLLFWTVLVPEIPAAVRAARMPLKKGHRIAPLRHLPSRPIFTPIHHIHPSCCARVSAKQVSLLGCAATKVVNDG